MDTRHIKRMKVVQNLYASSFEGNALPDSEEYPVLAEIAQKKEEIDALIEKYAPRYPLDKVSKVDLAVLRLAVYELIYEKANPSKVVIDEAVRLAKEFGTEKSYSFINGVLGSIMKNYKGQK